jgi:GNAT superfamily N-acetyltransferase
MMRNGGLPEDVAVAKAAADTEMLFPAGRPSPDQSVFVAEADGIPVGQLWVSERTDAVRRDVLWIFDIRIAEGYRGRGYGRETMLRAEEEARRRGLGRIALNVFGGNDVARNLYRSLGYVETSVVMGKTV